MFTVIVTEDPKLIWKDDFFTHFLHCYLHCGCWDKRSYHVCIGCRISTARLRSKSFSIDLGPQGFLELYGAISYHFLLFSCLGGCWIAVLPWSSRNDFSSARGWGDNNWNFHLFNQLFLRLRLSHKIIVNMFNCCPVLTELMPPAVCVSIHHCSFYLSYITFQLKELLKDKLSRIEFLWVYQSCDDVETFSFSSLLLQEGSEPPHILFHLGLKKKKTNLTFLLTAVSMASSSSHIHFPSYCFTFILIICALNWSGHKSKCTIKFTHAAILLSQRRSSDARTHPVDKALPRRWIWWLRLRWETDSVGSDASVCVCVCRGLMWYPKIGFESSIATCQGVGRD